MYNCTFFTILRSNVAVEVLVSEEPGKTKPKKGLTEITGLPYLTQDKDNMCISETYKIYVYKCTYYMRRNTIYGDVLLHLGSYYT